LVEEQEKHCCAEQASADLLLSGPRQRRWNEFRWGLPMLHVTFVGVAVRDDSKSRILIIVDRVVPTEKLSPRIQYSCP